MDTNRNAHAYRVALRLHKMAWQRRIEGKAKWFWQKDTFDDSYLPEMYKDKRQWNRVNRKLKSFVTYENMENGKFKAVLNIDEAIILLIKDNLDNIHYQNSFDIDLNNYKLGGDTFKIEVK